MKTISYHVLRNNELNSIKEKQLEMADSMSYADQQDDESLPDDDYVLQVDNKRYEQPLTISNCLNEFFCNVPSTLAAQLPKSHKSATSYLSQRRKQFRFAQVSEIEVFLLLESLDTNTSFGIDKIHPPLLKTAALQIYRTLTFIFNLSINKGIFPDSMKLAKVVPIFKQGSRFACSNYRPISVLSSKSKIFERCIFNQLMFYFTNNNMISPKQYGFRPGFTI